jgi:transposase
MTTSRVTSDFIVDCIEEFWATVQTRFPQVRSLLINADNGPENHSRRTQFMARLARFADQTRLTVELAYYPPYHSKYNPIERVWGGLEQHWNGSLLDSVDTAIAFAKTLTWRSRSPLVQRIDRIYETGKRLTQTAMNLLEERLLRLPGLERWFVSIQPAPLETG